MVNKNWKTFDPDIHLVAILNGLKEKNSADVNSDWNKYLASGQTTLKSFEIFYSV